jgi:hypothetical protein
MARSTNGVETDKSGNGDLEPYYRLVELQKQMIDLIQKNAHAKRECAALREQLAREVEALARSRRGLSERLRHFASAVLERLLRRNGEMRRNPPLRLVRPGLSMDAVIHGPLNGPVSICEPCSHPVLKQETP